MGYTGFSSTVFLINYYALPPIAVGAGIHNGAIGVRGFVPMQVVVSIKNAATQAMMNMASGGDPFANVR